MFLLLLCFIITTPLFGSDAFNPSNKYAILDLPKETRLAIANFLDKPSEKYVLFPEPDRKQENFYEKFYYDELLKKNLDDAIRYTTVHNLGSGQYEQASEKNEIFYLYNCAELTEKLNLRYNAFISNQRNLLKYCNPSLLKKEKEETFNRLCPGINTIVSRGANDQAKQATIITNENDITIHEVYNDPIGYLKKYIDTNKSGQSFPLRILIHNYALFNDIYTNFSLIEKYPSLSNIIQNQDGTTLLVTAIENNKIKIVELLVQKEANVNVEDVSDRTPLIIAIESDRIKIAELLIKKGTCINTKDRYGRTPLIVAIKNHYIEMAELLIQKGADVNAQPGWGDIPLIIAIKNHYIEMETDNILKNQYDEAPVPATTVAKKRISALKKLQNCFVSVVLLLPLLTYIKNRKNTFLSFISKRRKDFQNLLSALKQCFNNHKILQP